MGVLDKFQSTMVDVKINIPQPIESLEEDKIPEIVLQDTRIPLTTREDMYTMDKLMVAHKLEDYRRSRSVITLLPQVEIEFEKLLRIDREALLKEPINL